MLTSKFKSNRIIFNNLNKKDINNEYLSWLNDKDVTEYTSINVAQSLKDINKYIKDNNESLNSILLKCH